MDEEVAYADHHRGPQLISLLVGAHFVGVMLASIFNERRPVSDAATVLIDGLITGQVNLAALWVGLGRAPIVYRWGTLAAVLLSWTYVMHTPERDDAYNMSGWLMQAGIAVILTQLLVLSGLKLMPPPDEDHVSVSDDGGVVRWDLAHLFAITTSVACVAGSLALSGQPVTVGSIRNDLVYNYGPIAAFGLISAGAVLCEGNWFWRTLLVLACAFLVGTAQLVMAVLSAVEWSVETFMGVFDWWIYTYPGFTYAFNSLVVCLSLGMFRVQGIRLIWYWQREVRPT